MDAGKPINSLERRKSKCAAQYAKLPSKTLTKIASQATYVVMKGKYLLRVTFSYEFID